MLKFLRKTALWIVLSPIVVGFFGAGLNQAVLVANHDQFPVMWSDAKVYEYKLFLENKAQSEDEDTNRKAQILLVELDHGYLDDTHVLMTPQTHLNFLADWIDLKDATYSIGDALIELAEWASVYTALIWLVVVVQKLRKQE